MTHISLQPKLNTYTIVYQFNNSKFGFQNSVTVTAINIEQAANKAKKEVSDCYGRNMLYRFSFNEPIIR